MKKINCILLVDDNPADNEFHKIKITEAGVCNHIRFAYDGAMALEYIQNSAKDGNEEEYPKADLIFLDINMPRVNGFEFLEAYQQLDPKLKSEVVIVMLTTSLNPDDHVRAMNTKEVTEFHNKPLTEKSVRDLIELYF